MLVCKVTMKIWIYKYIWLEIKKHSDRTFSLHLSTNNRQITQNIYNTVYLNVDSVLFGGSATQCCMLNDLRICDLRIKKQKNKRVSVWFGETRTLYQARALGLSRFCNIMRANVC